ncbi:MAG: prolyl oligopeptidase family serine peptidase [Thermoflexibacter sp.]
MTDFSEYEKCIFTNQEGEKLLYRLLKPHLVDNLTYPLVIHLHGVHERGQDNEIQLRNGGSLFLIPTNRQNFPAFVMFPQCPPKLRWGTAGWDDSVYNQTVSPTMQLVLDTINFLIKNYPIDTKRLYIMGLSMGGFGVLDVAMRRPKLFAAVIAICGGGIEQMAERIKTTPVWLFHGTEDEVVKVEYSRRMYEALKKVGGKVLYKEYPDTKHDCWIKVYQEPDLLPWLFSQHL